MPRLTPWRPSSNEVTGADSSLGWDRVRYADNNELGTLMAQCIGLAMLAVYTLSSNPNP